MDELKLKLSTKFMRGFIANLAAKAILKHLGYHIDIEINEIEAKTEGGNINLHLNVDASVDNAEFMKIIKTIGMD